MQKTTKSCLIIFLVLFFSNISLQAQTREQLAGQLIKDDSSFIYEHILSFHSDIKIDSTGRVDVTETIWVLATGESIQRGIVRSIPVYRKNIYNLERRIDIQVDSVLKNGEAEKFATKVEGRDFAIYIGNENVTLSPDIYEYTIKYWSRGHVGFFDDYDELYWNVNGNEWAFDIDSISATVHLPTGSRFINSACYTGLEGSTAKDCSYRSIGDTIVEFYSNTAFKKNEGLTIAAAFTPNIIKRPPPPTAFEAFMESNGFGAISILISLTFIIFSIIALRRVNTMNGRAISIPLFNPPAGKSASDLRYLFKQEADNKVFMVCLLSMAVKKAILIKNSDKDFILTSLGYTDELSNEELEVYQKLFTGVNKDVVLTKKNTSSVVGKALTKLRELLHKNSILTDYYLPKAPYTIKIIILSVLLFAFWFTLVNKFSDMPIESFWQGIFLSVILPLVLSIWYPMRRSCFGYVFLFIMVVPSIIEQIIYFSDSPYYKYSIILSWVLAIMDILFARYVKPLTKQGFKFETELEGFKMYLSVAEENRLNILTPPDMTPEKFEKMLPYAVALDLEIKWAKKFEKYFPSNNYQPSWYLGETSGTYVDFTSSLTKSLAYSIKYSIPSNTTTSGGGFTSGRSSSGGRSSSSGSRSFSSGSSGRGSSGRGGGGGGGRGW